jgi:uncharacterized repeat protein (TIGR01451 family)
VDASGSAYVTGFAGFTDFPTTVGAFDTTHNGGGNDPFVTKLDAAGSNLAYSTFLGGGGNDVGLGIAVNASGSAYVTGFTNSTDFPTTSGAFDTVHNGADDVFVTKLNPTGSAPLVSTYLGGVGFDQGLGIAVDASGSAYVTGFTNSTDFPTTSGAFDTASNGEYDAFVTKIDEVVAPTPADLSLTKTDSPDPVKVGELLTYTITVTNGGPGPATGVTVEDELPSSADFQSASASQGTCTHSGGTVTCTLGSMANAGTATVTIEVLPRSTGIITNTATVAGAEPDLDTANNTDSEPTEVRGAKACDTPGGSHSKKCQ